MFFKRAMQVPLYIIIATAFKRSLWLIHRSLKSVYLQKGVNRNLIHVFIVDDNEDDNEYVSILQGIKRLREDLQIEDDEFPTRLINNTRTKGMSGTGAWNTGIFLAHHESPECFVSILDDDDEYLNHHLMDCCAILDQDTAAVFQRLHWIHHDGTQTHFPIRSIDLTPESFFIGNPGVQGSNMFIKVEYLVALNGFDETLPNTTDRDLLIRFLQYVEQTRTTKAINLRLIEKSGVVHYNHDQVKVNNQFLKKQTGLDLFYSKHRNYFSEEAYQKSLQRAKMLFNYLPKDER